jgi:hypothetical protein
MPIQKPGLSFVVGVTGHRSARLPNNTRANIVQRLDEVFRNIEAECKAELDRQREFYDGSAPALRLVSSLADGADATAVQRCPKTWRVIGILPSPEETYIEALRSTAPPDSAESAVAEFDAARETAQQVIVLPKTSPDDKRGYVRARNMMLRQIDMLIAVWDGQSSADGGGTGDVVARALEDGIPVVWISSKREQPARVISQIEDGKAELPYADAISGPVTAAVRQVLGFRERHASRQARWKSQSTEASAESRLREFLNEDVPDRCNWMAYDWIKIGLLRPWKWRLTKKLASVDDVRRDWAPFLAAIPAAGTFNKGLEEILLPRFAAADALATYYSSKYRSAYVLVYLFSVFAVAAALSDFLFFDLEPQSDMPLAKLPLAVIELFFLGGIVGIVLWGQSRQWHSHWLDYRALAETLRHLRFLGLLGQYENSAYAEAAARPGAGWVLWYLRATMRELGIPSGYLGPDYQRKTLSAIIPAELEPQIEYHASNMDSLRRLHHRLHLIGNWCFATAAIILFAFVVVYSLHTVFHVILFEPRHLAKIAAVVAVMTAFLPSLGAALAGIRFTGDFEGFAERSADTGAELDLLKERYALALERLDFDLTVDVVIEVARIMAVDFNGWTALYSRKRLTLPG